MLGSRKLWFILVAKIYLENKNNHMDSFLHKEAKESKPRMKANI